MAIICKLRKYTVKEAHSTTLLQNLALLLAISIVAAGAVLGVCIMVEPTAKAAARTHNPVNAPVAQQEPAASPARH